MLVANKRIWISSINSDTMIELYAISCFQNGSCVVDGFMVSLTPEELIELKQIWIDYIENLKDPDC